VAALQHSKLPEILVAAMDRATTDPRIRAMHDSMTQIGRTPVWTVVAAGIDRDEPTVISTKDGGGSHTRPPSLPVPLRQNADHIGRRAKDRQRQPRPDRPQLCELGILGAS
jgi:hypothetical protein